MPICQCGCCEETVNGDFLQGHDQKLRAQLEKITGGLLPLRNLVESAQQYSTDEISLKQFGDKATSIMKNP